MREPAFWRSEAGIGAAALAPLAAVYGAIAARRLEQPGYEAGIPVICVGNLTVGGTGKTPTASAIGKMLEEAGRRPFFLSRGYGGRLRGPVRVDAGQHSAADVGDEPLLLARQAPTVVSRDRAAGAQTARAAGANVIVMDDGFQNPSLSKTLSILVVDARRGIGNGRVIPAGPLRAPLAAQLRRAQALLVVGDGRNADAVVAQAQSEGRSIHRARLVPDKAVLAMVRTRPVLAFAGIGDPDKFFDTLSDAAVDIQERRRFPDHHRYTASEAADLVAEAQRKDLRLVTTEKDCVRLVGHPALAAAVTPLPVAMQFENEAAFRALVLSALR